jgi:hypothetical protein
MQDEAASARDSGDRTLIKRFGEAFWRLPDGGRAAFVAHVLLGEQVEIIAALFGRKPRWVMDSIRDVTARLSSCCAPDGRFALSLSELRESGRACRCRIRQRGSTSGCSRCGTRTRERRSGGEP